MTKGLSRSGDGGAKVTSRHHHIGAALQKTPQAPCLTSRGGQGAIQGGAPQGPVEKTKEACLSLGPSLDGPALEGLQGEEQGSRKRLLHQGKPPRDMGKGGHGLSVI